MKPDNVCRHLRTKKMFIPAEADQVFSVEDGHFTHSGHCWCNKTCSEVGFDDRQVSVQLCNPSRSCFEE
ncbi:MAG TPA: hypothetical protein GYA07_04915 [Verrucomicrobia bacterium]|nr:hypothetical protein [Verrucomicrobiota bacterium]HOP96384.1 hypothetical protein [Verrucomicrobiota bacterium]HPU57029.1 hypothetical protein [Verrucomicrobiota bacterium]